MAGTHLPLLLITRTGFLLQDLPDHLSHAQDIAFTFPFFVDNKLHFNCSAGLLREGFFGKVKILAKEL